MKTIAIAGSLDTKGEEFLRLKKEIEGNGLAALLIDFGTRGSPIQADYSAEMVANAAGSSLAQVRNMPPAQALDTMGSGAAQILLELLCGDAIHGFISMGGGQGTCLAMHCLRALPAGFPKLLLSTLAAVPHRASMFSGCMDACLLNPIVDISGENTILETAVAHAAGAVCGMALFGKNRISAGNGVRKKRVALSMLGVTTPCVSRVGRILEAHGVEPVTFVANEQAGNSMERMIRDGDIDCVADLTLAELTRAYIENGCASSDGRQRLEAAAAAGIPMVVSLGGLDLCNLTLPVEVIQSQYADRKLHMHNADICVLRTSAAENRKLGEVIAQRLNQAKGRTALFVPKLGLSSNDMPGKSFYDPEADSALFQSLEEHLGGKTEQVWMDNHINDPAFADAVAEKILTFLCCEQS